MTKLIYILFFMVLSNISWGQQDAVYSQYAYNQYAINPAYAGSRSSFSGVILHRSQWVGIKDAPRVESFTIHSPLSTSSLAYGVNVNNESVGPLNSTSANVSLGYHIRFKKAKLSFALRGGIYNTTLNRDLLTFKESTDVYNVGGKVSSLVPNIDFGTYFYTKRFFVGLSLNHLTNENISFDAFPNSSNLILQTHLYLHSGYVFDLVSNIKVKPTILIKVTEGANLNMDLGVNFMFLEKFWLGASIRNSSSINILTEWNVFDYLRVGYAYDFSINKLMKYNSGSHELFLGFDFNLKNRNIKIVSPRYL
ncbi:hypothetical protein DNU06_13955 [Putridiphycobacter roseus]|uniref:Type IX secretion system membrane protein PorP/SprF n=1 Tax=Putridiphycobacter roseus TaxID=2219161 RepID=A0A2W1NNP7_9FLAO|nr:type IX secretion system membrane protein PorP/SprF [Putridiphycobacter roseus]PZE16228.1 hypothetical protein DNU06_13955 [Putridiphycobacter roseus]